MREIAGLSDRKALYIYDKDRIFLGGDQSWFGKERLKKSGCGIIAAANIFIQLSAKPYFSRLYEKNEGKTGKEEYIRFMEKLSLFIKPFYFLGISFGIWNSFALIRGIKKYAKTQNLRLRFEKRYPRQNYEKTRNWLIGNLNEERPLFILIGLSTRFFNTKVSYIGGGEVSGQNLALHWMSVRALLCDDAGEEYLEVLTWGGLARIRFKDWQKGFWPQALFCMKEST
ncbi:MAG: hypothetical protein Q4A19_04635 [Johnsonella sp.]|nr:hypothetical protein [Johnsonella sp.]